MIGFLSTKKASHLAMLIKNSVAKNIMYEQRNCRFAASSISQYNIDAKKEFGVSVAASLLFIGFDGSASRVCQVKDFYTMKSVRVYGWANDCFVADMVSYKNSEFIDGRSQLTWWSGMKHDCAKVMELKRAGDRYVNGLGECVDIEDDVVYPLLKSSDIKGDSILSVQKYVIVTQKGTSEDTDWMKDSCPKAYKYLSQHANLLDERRSVIYRNRPRFCIFGIGSYSFKPYKVVISGLYKQTRFSLVKAIEDKPVMLDDTCYLLGFDRLDDALAAQCVLNSKLVQSFINSLLFIDAKRVINKELLMRIDVLEAARYLAKENLCDGIHGVENFIAMLKSKALPKQYALFG